MPDNAEHAPEKEGYSTQILSEFVYFFILASLLLKASEV